MNKSDLANLVESTTGAIFLGQCILLSVVDMEKAGMTETEKFWTRLIAAEAEFDGDGNLTPESASRILAQVEALSFQCNVISLELLRGVGIMPAALERWDVPIDAG